MTRRPWSRSAAVLGAFLALTLPVLLLVRAPLLGAQDQGAANEKKVNKKANGNKKNR